MKPLQGNLDFFLIRASRGPFRLKHKTQGPSHIYIPKGKLLLKCLWKDGLPLHSKTGNHSHPEMIWGAQNIPEAALLKLKILSTWDGCLRESLDISLIFKGFLNMISIVSTCPCMKLVACIDYKNETSLLRLVVQVDCLLEILRIFCISSISRPWASCQLWNRYY